MTPRPNLIRGIREETGASHDEIAALLTDRLGRTISAARVKVIEKDPGRLPKSWAAALGLDAPPQGDGQEPADGLRESAPPRPPSEDAVQPRAASPAQGVDSSGFGAVRDRIAKFYGAVGAGTSMLTQNDGYAKVADAYSRDLADAWIAAARENVNVAKIVAFMESGGPVGELVIAHLILVGGFVYVSGRGPDLDFLYAGKFESYRRAAALRAAAADVDGEPGFNGSAPVGAAGPVGDAPR